MCARLRHRGPDDEGVQADPDSGVALGARRLSIIDVEGGHQPLSNEDGTVWAALNGEIYNHPLLQEHLRASGHQLATRTDTEVLVHLYEEYGPALVHALEGMFAFAIWDSRRGRLLLARDRFGEKPLFYREQAGTLTFASELHALLAGTTGGLELDPSVVDAFFVFGYVPGPESIAAGVAQVPPGHLLIWDRESRRTELQPYWSPPETRGGAAEPMDELVVEAQRLLESSVASRMIADVPLGVFLSGGVDSTLIAALAARCSRTPIKTFTVGYDVGEVSETDFARTAAQAVGSEHHELVLTEAEIAERVPRLLSQLDQPLADQALVAAHAVAELARTEVTVAIGGEGADEIFAGYPRYRWLKRAGRLGELVPDAAAASGAALLARAPVRDRGRRLSDVLAPGPMLERQVDWVTAGRRHLRSALYGPLLSDALSEDRSLARLAGRARLSARGGDANGDLIATLMSLDQRDWLPDDVLAKADRAGMLASLEVRTPYLERELVEFAATIPATAHARNGGKAILRALLDEALPQLGRSRRKTAFRVPAADWLRGPLAPALEQQIEAGALFQEGWFDRSAVARVRDEHVSGSRDGSSVLWPVLSLGTWLDAARRPSGP